MLGIAAGFGATALVSGLMRHVPGRSLDPGRPASSPLPVRIGLGLTKLLRLTISSGPLRQDLNVLGRSAESLAVATTLAAVTAAAGAVVVCAGLEHLGSHLPISVIP